MKNLNIIIIHSRTGRGKTAFARLENVLRVAGHNVTAAVAVNDVSPRELSILEPGASSFRQLGFDCIDVVCLAPYDVATYCGHERFIEKIADQMSDRRKWVCGIIPGLGGAAALEEAGLTSFVTAHELARLNRKGVRRLLERIAADAAKAIRDYDERPDVQQSRCIKQKLLRIAVREARELNEAQATSPKDRTNRQDYLVQEARMELSRLYCS